MEHGGRSHNVTGIVIDGSSLWVGTDTGGIFLCDITLKSIEKIQSMPRFSNINLSYIDDQEEWWFSTNENIFVYDYFLHVKILTQCALIK